MVNALPTEASVLLPVSLIRSWLVQGGSTATDHNADMTVAEVATLFNRSPQTVRAWIRHGDLDAYRLWEKEYRVTRDALEGFLAFQRGRNTPRGSLRSLSGQPANLQSWRSARSS
jgi:excisionase family DNA binding protein